jgi:hypothetical protein
MKGGPFPATVSAEGAQFNVPPSLWERAGVRGTCLLMNAMDGKDMPFKVRYGGLDFHT